MVIARSGRTSAHGRRLGVYASICSRARAHTHTQRREGTGWQHHLVHVHNCVGEEEPAVTKGVPGSAVPTLKGAHVSNMARQAGPGVPELASPRLPPCCGSTLYSTVMVRTVASASIW